MPAFVVRVVDEVPESMIPLVEALWRLVGTCAGNQVDALRQRSLGRTCTPEPLQTSSWVQRASIRRST
jgi:hypothetical protein